MSENYKNSYKATDKELVSLSVYNVGCQRCDPGYQWGPGIRDHYLIHYIISGKGSYRVKGSTHHLEAGDVFLIYPNTEVVYQADESDPWEYAWVGFNGSDAATILTATDFSATHPYIHHVPHKDLLLKNLLRIYEIRGNEFEHLVEMSGPRSGCKEKRDIKHRTDLRAEKHRIHQRQLLLSDYDRGYCLVCWIEQKPLIPFLRAGHAPVSKGIPDGFSHEAGVLSFTAFLALHYCDRQFRRL